MKPWDTADLADVEEAMSERLDGLLAEAERLVVSGASSDLEVHARFLLEGGPDGERLELEARVELGRAGLTEGAARDLALDALDSVLLDHLESGRAARFSGVFEERELRGKPVAVRVERTVPALEAQADLLLGGSGDGKDGEA
ncbi:MAG: hypothetical protein HY901_35670 [Deltaproteobacteria bacterium]|nr:hypothetical protein [Deltaproteobacteria bacterium]